MIAQIVVAILLEGRPILGTRSATLERGTVVAPLDPYVRRIAERISTAGGAGRIAISRGDQTIVVAIGSPFARSGSIVQTLSIAPFVRGGEPNIPLAAVARALGATADYEGTTHTLSLRFIRPPLTSMTLDPTYVPPSAPVTFTPQSTAQPRAVVTGIPHPRRTPILVKPGVTNVPSSGFSSDSNVPRKASLRRYLLAELQRLAIGHIFLRLTATP